MAYSYVSKREQDETTYSYHETNMRPLLRQIFIASSAWAIYFCIGIVFGAPTVLIPQLRRNANVTGPVTDNMASWLSSTFSYASIPWIFILSNMARVFGRKKISIFISFSTIAGFIVFYFSSTPVHILITESVFGVLQASVVSITVLIISEYTDPKYRGVFLCIKSASTFWGIWTSNAIGTFTHWKFMPVAGFICSLWSLSVFFWPESPHWLASKKRFAECRKSHRWLRGEGKNAESELDKLIRSHSDLDNEEYSMINLKFIRKREFYMPLLLSMLVVSQYHLSGKFVITIHALEVIKRIITDETTVYRSMLILDAVTVFSTYIGCYLNKLYRRRNILLISSSIATICLLILSLYLYLVNVGIYTENIYISLFFLSGFSWSISCGPMIMATSLYGELIPTKFKSISIIIIALQFVLMHGTLLKVSPLIFKALGIHGTFLFYGLSSVLCIILVYFYLPETKDKTLLEIEEYFKDGVGKINESQKLVSVT